MLKFNLKTASVAMSYLINADKARQETEKIIGKSQKDINYCADGKRVASTLFKIREYENLRDFISDINSYVFEARKQGAQLVAFPQLVGMTALTFMPGYKKIKAELITAHRSGKEQEAAAFVSLVEATQGFVGEVFLNVFSQMAKDYKIIIAGGGFYHSVGSEIYNTMYGFDETGSVCARQDKIFLSPKERKWGVTPGKNISLGETSLGKLALISSGSTFRYEPFFIARTMGAQMCVVAASPFGPDTGCCVHRANENCQCLIVSGIDTAESGLGLKIKEKPMIAVPYSLSQDRNGVLKIGEEKVLTAYINDSKLKESFDVYASDLNLNFVSGLINLEKGVDIS